MPHSTYTTKILVVEDNEINQDVVQSILERAGFEVSLANDGFAALAALQQDSYAVILMDIQMPAMDGYEATRRIRQNPAWAATPIIAMTAGGMSTGGLSTAQEIAAAGMDDYVIKPFNSDDLLATVQHWIPASSADEDATHGFSADSFQAAHGHAIQAIRVAIEAEENELAARLARALQDAAAKIGDIALQQIASELETALLDNDPIVIEQFLAQADLQLQKTIAALAALKE